MQNVITLPNMLQSFVSILFLNASQLKVDICSRSLAAYPVGWPVLFACRTVALEEVLVLQYVLSLLLARRVVEVTVIVKYLNDD